MAEQQQQGATFPEQCQACRDNGWPVGMFLCPAQAC